jgi:hypothetical protein
MAFRKMGKSCARNTTRLDRVANFGPWGAFAIPGTRRDLAPGQRTSDERTLIYNHYGCWWGEELRGRRRFLL